MDFVAFLKEVKVNVMCLEQVTVPHRFLQHLVWQWQGTSNKKIIPLLSQKSTLYFSFHFF